LRDPAADLNPKVVFQCPKAHCKNDFVQHLTRLNWADNCQLGHLRDPSGSESMQPPWMWVIYVEITGLEGSGETAAAAIEE